MEKIIEMIHLVAKTGLFFAHCDGRYDERERRFIEDYIAGIEQMGSIEDSLKASVRASLNRQFTLAEIVGDTKAMLTGFTDGERRRILASIDEFVRRAIRIDHHVDTEEQRQYVAWKQAVGLV